MDVPRPAGPTGFSLRSGFHRAASLALVATALAGCTSEDPILVETVPKDPPPRTLVAEVPVADDRMLAAIIPRGETAWFFKMTGSDASVVSKKAAFLDLVRSVRFEENELRWTLPKGWKEGPGNAMRLATLEVPGDPPLSVAVSSLSYPDDDPTGFLLANVNRWRDQMSLPHIDAARLHAGGDLDDETQQLELADGTEATLVNFKGAFESGGMTPPFAAGRSAAAETRSAPKAPASVPFKYETPTGWEEVGADGISLATFTVKDGDATAKVTVTPLPASAYQLQPNLLRWRDQVGLPKLPEGETDAAVKAVESIPLGDGDEGQYAVLVGPDSASPQQAILIVVAVRGDTAWFIKLFGDSELALRERPNFESFVKSFRFTAEGG